MPLICEALGELKVKYRGPEMTPEGVVRVRVGGLDKRKLQFKGWIELEDFENEGVKGAFCVMVRDQVSPRCTFVPVPVLMQNRQGNPISWRQLWKSIILSAVVEPHVYRKR